MAWQRAASINDLKSGQSKVVNVAGKDLALFNVDGKFYCIDNTCPHRQGPLGEGTLEGMDVRCPLHGSKFNIKTGAVDNPPAKTGVKAYVTKIEGTSIMVDV